jgi:curli biogenesis system outer membrane secretion channel CsgG
MKKKLTILAALLCCLCLTACAGRQAETVHLPEASPTVTPTPVPTMPLPTPPPCRRPTSVCSSSASAACGSRI